MDGLSIDEVILSVFFFRKQQLLGCARPNVLKDVEWKQEWASEGFASNDYKILRLEIISADCCRMSLASRIRVRVNSLAHKFLLRRLDLELSCLSYTVLAHSMITNKMVAYRSRYAVVYPAPTRAVEYLYTNQLPPPSSLF